MDLKRLLLENSSAKQILFKNTFWLSVGNVLGRVFKFALIIYAARALGPGQYGVFNYALSLFAFLFLFSDIGIGALIVREYQKEEDKDTLLATSILLRFTLIALSSFAAFAVFFFISDPAVQSIFFLILALYVVQALKEMLIAVVRADNRMEYEGIALLVEAVATTVLGLVFLHLSPTAMAFSVAYLLGASIAALFSITFIASHFHRQATISLAYAKRILSFAWPFAFGAVVYSILTNTDTVMLQWLKGNEAVGYYSVGTRVLQVLILVPGILSTAIFPTLATLIDNKERFAQLFRTATAYALMFAAPLLVGGVMTAPRLVGSVFGAQYLPGVTAFQILLAMLPFTFMTILLDYLLFAFNYQLQDMAYTSVASVLNIVLNIALIPAFSLNGSAVSSLAAQIANFLLTYWLARRVLRYNIFPGASALRFGAAALGMAAVIALASYFAVTLWLIIPIAALAYFAFLLAAQEENTLYAVRSAVRVLKN